MKSTARYRCGSTCMVLRSLSLSSPHKKEVRNRALTPLSSNSHPLAHCHTATLPLPRLLLGSADGGSVPTQGPSQPAAQTAAEGGSGILWPRGQGPRRAQDDFA